MRAATITEHGQAPFLGERSEPALAPGHVLVATTAVPITPLDLLCATGTSYFGPPELPYVPGVQGVGVVRAFGLDPAASGAAAPGPAAPGAADDLVGRRVWFGTTAGMAPGDGSLSELCSVARDDVVVLPEGIDDAVAAGLGLSAVAAWEILEGRAALQPGEQVLVLGAGGVVGQAAVQAARLLGARRVVAAARSEGGRGRAAECGADAVAPLPPDAGPGAIANLLRDACDGPVDVVVDPLAGVPASAAVTLLARGGRLVNLGSSAGPSLAVDSAILRSRSAAVLGYTNNDLSADRRAHVMRTVLEHAAAGRIRVRFKTVPLGDVAAGWSEAAAGSPDGRVVVRIQP
jgi:NADPH:quinone reductase-like Zn-dependent oxidoreductase